MKPEDLETTKYLSLTVGESYSQDQCIKALVDDIHYLAKEIAFLSYEIQEVKNLVLKTDGEHA